MACVNDLVGTCTLAHDGIIVCIALNVNSNCECLLATLLVWPPHVQRVLQQWQLRVGATWKNSGTPGSQQRFVPCSHARWLSSLAKQIKVWAAPHTTPQGGTRRPMQPHPPRRVCCCCCSPSLKSSWRRGTKPFRRGYGGASLPLPVVVSAVEVCCAGAGADTGPVCCLGAGRAESSDMLLRV